MKEFWKRIWYNPFSYLTAKSFLNSVPDIFFLSKGSLCELIKSDYYLSSNLFWYSFFHWKTSFPLWQKLGFFWVIFKVLVIQQKILWIKKYFFVRYYKQYHSFKIFFNFELFFSLDLLIFYINPMISSLFQNHSNLCFSLIPCSV